LVGTVLFDGRAGRRGRCILEGSWRRNDLLERASGRVFFGGDVLSSDTARLQLA